MHRRLFTPRCLAPGTIQNSYSPFQDSIPGLALDSSGNAYVSGSTYHGDKFPVTAGAWRTVTVGSSFVADGYATKLDPSGHIVYSTFVGAPGWPVTPSRIQVRNGIAYLAGTLSSLAFLGTPGAFQRNLTGTSDFFVIALSAEASAPLFATAIGGSGSETLSDMSLDASRQFLLCGTSSSDRLSAWSPAGLI